VPYFGIPVGVKNVWATDLDKRGKVGSQVLSEFTNAALAGG
jgi:hypothetical protein